MLNEYVKQTIKEVKKELTTSGVTVNEETQTPLGIDEVLEAENEAKDTLIPITLEALMDEKYPDTEWLIEPLVPAGGITVISGDPASFKTWFVLELGLALAEGSILFDKFITNQGSVLIVDEENGKRLLQKRFAKLRKEYQVPIYLLSYKDIRVTESTVGRLINFSKANGVRLVIFDSLIRIHNADENSAREMAGVFKTLRQFSKAGIAVLFTHHNRKRGFLKSSPSQSMRGSSDILASVDCHLSVQRKNEELIIDQTKLRQEEEMKPFKLNIISDDDIVRLEYSGEIDAVQTKKENFQEAIKNLLEDRKVPMYKKEILDSLREGGVVGGQSTFKEAVNDLVEKEELFESKGEKNKVYLSLNQ